MHMKIYAKLGDSLIFSEKLEKEHLSTIELANNFINLKFEKIPKYNFS